MKGCAFSPFADRINLISSEAIVKPVSISEKKIGTIHFIGIGGIGMSGIAELLLNSGYAVSGSDMKRSDITEKLQKLGAKIFYEHDKNNIQDCSVVVYSAAVPLTNPEIREAKSKKIPVISRAEMLNELVRMKKGIGISGTHGKTTTTGMISYILTTAGVDPTMLIGGILGHVGSNAHFGKGEYLVFEACEAFGSIDYFLPEISVLLNIDRDHLDYYKTFDDLKATFLRFLNKVPFYSFCVANLDDDNIKSILPEISKRIITYGFSDSADVIGYNVLIEKGASLFNVKAFGKELGIFKINIPGMHNISNALAAISVAIEIGIDIKPIRDALENFKNSDRRFEILFSCKGITVIDDYAHHPGEITATLNAGRQFLNANNGKRLIAVFQPHLFSRTQMLYEGFAKSLLLADKIFLTEIYPAREKPIPGVKTALIFDLLKESNADVTFVEKVDDLSSVLLDEIKEDDVLITLGAGNITKIAHEISDKLK